MRLRFDIKTVTLLGFLLATSMGHGGHGCCEEEEVLGPPTETACPSGSTLTYDTFGRAFMEDFCTGCHSSTLTGDARHGATVDHDFDTLLGVRQVANHIDQTAGIGPGAENRNMPPEDETSQPSDEDRRRLAEWISCGAP